MAYCHQCGSEISEVEGFCPFCGISLQPIAVEGETDDKNDEFIHEIIDDSKENSAADSKNTPQPNESDENDLSITETIVGGLPDINAESVNEESDELADDFINEQNVNDESGRENNSASVNLSERDVTTSTQTEENIKFKTEENINQSIADSVTDNYENINEETDDAVIDNDTDLDENVELDSDIEPKNKTFGKLSESEFENEAKSLLNSDSLNSPQDKTESPSEQIESTVGEDNFDEISEFGLPDEKTENDIEDKKEVSETVSEQTGEDILEINDNQTSNIETEDKNVENDLEIDEENSATVSNQTESASEIDGEEDFSQKYNFDDGAQTILTGSKNLTQTSVSETENKTEVEQESVESAEKQIIVEEGSSSTTPNINVTDTGGKSTKLKPLDEKTVLNNRYEIIRKIGGGGMGAVYLASDKNLGGVLRAVKEMVQSYIEEAQQEKAISDFKRESMLLTSLEHSSIPTIYDYFYDEREARFYLVMKYISGGDLAARLKSAPEGRLDEKSVVEWGIQISDVLAYLHERQPPIVYRDLKPANIMIDGNSDRVMLIDFGIARWINKEEKGVTAVGTMGYAPPELFSGNVEPRSDVYSLGSTMFHLLTGADPQSNPLLIFDFQKHPRPRQINPNLSDQIEKILMRSVEYSADKRFNSSAQMRDALINHLEKLNNGQISYGINQTPQPLGLEEQPVFCGFCGQKIVASDMFCAFCGAKQPLAQPGIHSAEYTHSKPTARLIINGTSELDSPTFLLEKTDNLIGRRDPLSNIFPEVDLSKYDPQTKISRKHARIHRQGNVYLVEDLGSSNGTTVISATNDSVKLQPNITQMLNDGDKIKLGDTTLQFIIQ